MKSNFFVLGNPRSGTSMFRLMLNANSNIIVPPECGFIIWWFKKYGSADFQDKNVKIKFVQDLFTSKKIETWNLDIVRLTNRILKENIPDYCSVCNTVYDEYAVQNGKEVSLLGDKNNYYLNYIPEIAGIFKNVKFIHLVRDGRDVAVSYMDLSSKEINSRYAPKLPSDIVGIANEWNNNVYTIQNNLNTYSPNNHITIKYENLVFDPQVELDKICYFLGCNFSQDMLEYFHPRFSKMHEPKDFLSWKAKTLVSPDPSGIGRYKDVLSPAQINEFNTISHLMLKQFDYI